MSLVLRKPRNISEITQNLILIEQAVRKEEMLTKEKTGVFYDMNHDMILKNHDHDSHEAKKVKLEPTDRLKNQLSEWGVFYPEQEIKKHGLQKVQEAIERTRFAKPRIPGAYYKTIIRNF